MLSLNPGSVRASTAVLIVASLLGCSRPGDQRGSASPGVPATATPPPRASAAALQQSPLPGGDEQARSVVKSSAGSLAPADGGQPAATSLPPTSLPTGTTVLHIGDSFAGALGLDLNRALEAAGNRSILKYQTSSYIPNWAWGKEIEKYIMTFHPDLVLITLGANELGIAPVEQRIPTIQHLVQRIGDRPCVWVGPPLWEGARPDLLEVIRDNCAPCLYLDSTAYLPDLARAKDGIHPSLAARKEWAKFVAQWLAERRHPAGDRVWNLSESDSQRAAHR